MFSEYNIINPLTGRSGKSIHESWCTCWKYCKQVFNTDKRGCLDINWLIAKSFWTRIKKGTLSWPAKTAGSYLQNYADNRAEASWRLAPKLTHVQKQFPQLRKLRDRTAQSLLYFLRGGNSPRIDSLYWFFVIEVCKPFPFSVIFMSPLTP